MSVSQLTHRAAQVCASRLRHRARPAPRGRAAAAQASIGAAWLLRSACTLVVLLALGACSTVRFGYGQAERVLTWYAESYVTLDRRQSELLGQALASYKRWHCSTQLPGYAAWLRQAGSEFEAGPVPARIGQRTDNLLHFARILADEATPHLVPVVATLTDRQLEELRTNLETANRKYRETWVDRAEGRIRAERAARMRSRLEWWLGRLGAAQRARVERWAQELQLTGEDALESRRRWQGALLAALTHRDDPKRLQRELRAVLAEPDRYWTESLKRKLAANRDGTHQLLADVAGLMDDAQRARLQGRAETLAADFEHLGCAPGRTAAGRTAPGGTPSARTSYLDGAGS